MPKFRRSAISIFVSLCLSISFYHLVKPTCGPQAGGDLQSFYYFTVHSQIHSDLAGDSDQSIPQWKKRIIGMLITGALTDLAVTKDNHIQRESFETIYAAYHTVWLFAVFAILILFKQDLLVIVGTFAGLMLYRSDPTPLYMPWDMPTLFFFTLGVLCYRASKIQWMIAALLIGSLFKETNLLPALLLLFYKPWSFRRRVLAFGAVCIVAAVLVKGFALLLNPSAEVSKVGVAVFSNIKELITPNLRYVGFVNCGTLLLLLILRTDIATKTLAVMFVIGQLFWGTFHEFRIWYEMLPLGWMAVSGSLNSTASTPAASH